jgi:ureidoacrylate peracid hydrolase
MEVVVTAKPESIHLDIDRTALIVVDMQNAFCKKGGMLDVTHRLDEARVAPVVKVARRVIEISRSAGIKVIYLRMAYNPDMSNAGGPESPHYWKEHGVIAMREHPEWKGRFLTIGTWDWEIIDELKPHHEDIVVDKSRYSGFVNTELDAILRMHNIKHLLFLGFATNVCVESTLRDAFFHEYFPVIISDGCGHAGPDYTQKATIWNVSELFGWVTTSDDLVKALA